MGRGTIPQERVYFEDGEKLYFGDDNQWSLRRDQGTGEFVFRHEPTGTDVSKYTENGEEVNRTTSETVVISQSDPTDFIKMVNETTGDEVRAWVTGDNNFLFSVYEDDSATLRDVFRFDIANGNLEALNDVVFPNEADNPAFTTHDHSESSLPDVPNSGLSNSSVTVNSGNGTDGVGDVSLGDSFSVDISDNGVGSNEISPGSVGEAHLGFNPYRAKYVSPILPDNPNEREIWMKLDVMESVWNRDTGAITVHSIGADSGALYAGDDAGWVYSFDFSSGDILWEELVHNQHVTSIETDGNNVYTVANDGYMYARDTSDGSYVWADSYPGSNAGSLAHNSDYVYYTNSDGWLFSLSKSGGNSNFSQQAISGVADDSACASGGVVCAEGNTLNGFDPNDGSSMWSHSEHGGNVSGMDSDNQNVYSVGNGSMCISTTASDGSTNWSVSPISGSFNDVSYYAGYLFAAHDGGGIVVMDSSDGSTVKTFDEGTSRLSVIENSIFMRDEGDRSRVERYGFSMNKSINVYYDGQWVPM